MKSSIKGTLVLLLLLNSFLISITKEVSSKTLRRTLSKNKKFSANNYSSKVKTKITSSVSSNTKLEWTDWTNLDYLLPIAFAKGVTSQFSGLIKVTTILGFILNPQGATEALSCKKISEKVSTETFSKVITTAQTGQKPLNDGQKEISKIVQGEATTFTKDTIKEYIKQAFGKSEEEKTQIKEADICKDIKTITYSIENVEDILAFIDSNKKADQINVETTAEQSSQDIKNKSNSISSAIGNDSTDRVSGDAEKDLIISYSSPFFTLKSNVSKISNELEAEAKEIYKNCLEDKAFAQILILNEDEYNKKSDSCFIKITSTATWNESIKQFETGLMSSDFSCKEKLSYTIFKIKTGFTDLCKPALKEYYTNKQIEIADIEKQKSACEEQKKKEEADKAAAKPGVGLLPRLTNFTLEFLKNISKCVVIGFITGLLTLGVKILVNIIVQILTSGVITLLKIIWYVGRSLYYLRKAYIIDDENVKDDKEKKEKKRLKAETYGIAVGNVVKIALSTLGVSWRKKLRNNRFIKRRMTVDKRFYK